MQEDAHFFLRIELSLLELPGFPAVKTTSVQALRKLKIGNNYINRRVKFSRLLLFPFAESALDDRR